MGKWSLLMVLGFSMVALSIMPRVTWRVNEAFRNFVGYQDTTVAHNIGVSAANMAANGVFINGTWRTGFPSTTYSGGTFSATVANMTGSDSSKVKIVAIGNYQAAKETCTVILAPGSFSKICLFLKQREWHQLGNTRHSIWTDAHTRSNENQRVSDILGKSKCIKRHKPHQINRKFLWWIHERSKHSTPRRS